MPGPIMHQNAMERCGDLLHSLNLPLEVGNKIEVMEPDKDRHGSHGWDFVRSNRGSIINKMERVYVNIKHLFKDCYYNIGNLDKDAFNHEVLFLCHYTTDAHSIGQLSSELWGKKDTMIDAACEFIINKKCYPVKVRTYPSIDVLKIEILSSMRSVFNKYHRKAKKWNFIFKKDMRSMGRNAIQKGAEFATSWIDLALLK